MKPTFLLAVVLAVVAVGGVVGLRSLPSDAAAAARETARLEAEKAVRDIDAYDAELSLYDRLAIPSGELAEADVERLNALFGPWYRSLPESLRGGESADDVQFNLGDIQAAWATVEQLIADAPRRLERAVESARKAVAATPNDPRANSILGLAHYAKGTSLHMQALRLRQGLGRDRIAVRSVADLIRLNRLEADSVAGRVPTDAIAAVRKLMAEAAEGATDAAGAKIAGKRELEAELAAVNTRISTMESKDRELAAARRVLEREEAQIRDRLREATGAELTSLLDQLSATQRKMFDLDEQSSALHEGTWVREDGSPAPVRLVPNQETGTEDAVTDGMRREPGLRELQGYTVPVLTSAIASRTEQIRLLQVQLDSLEALAKELRDREAELRTGLQQMGKGLGEQLASLRERHARAVELEKQAVAELAAAAESFAKATTERTNQLAVADGLARDDMTSSPSNRDPLVQYRAAELSSLHAYAVSEADARVLSAAVLAAQVSDMRDQLSTLGMLAVSRNTLDGALVGEAAVIFADAIADAEKMQELLAESRTAAKAQLERAVTVLQNQKLGFHEAQAREGDLLVRARTVTRWSTEALLAVTRYMLAMSEADPNASRELLGAAREEAVNAIKDKDGSGLLAPARRLIGLIDSTPGGAR